jgi:hypothetical protein
VTDRQAHAFANPVADPALVSVDEGFRQQRRMAAGVLITILTVNR